MKKILSIIKEKITHLLYGEENVHYIIKNGQRYKINISGPIDGDRLKQEDLNKPLLVAV